MSKDSPKVKINSRAINKRLKRAPRPEHANYTFRFEKELFDKLRKKAELEGFSATQVLEALMRSYLGI